MTRPQNVLVTGTTSGFGALTARTLLRGGHTVVATMRDHYRRNAPAAAALRAFAADAAGTLHLLEMDVTRTESVNACVRDALDAVGHLDVVVNNAGVGSGGITEAFTADQLLASLEVNVVGVHRVNRAVLPHMRARGRGLLVHLSTVMGRVVLPFGGPYTAAKFALEGLAESLRYELAPTGVDVVIVEPGGFGTRFMDNVVLPEDTARVQGYGAVAHAAREMWSGFAAMMEAAAPDPQEVVDTVVRLMEMPAGTRPLRTVVDPLTGGAAPRAVNEATERVQAELLDSVGMGALRSVAPAAVAAVAVGDLPLVGETAPA